jgi:uncharacterized DUF497 family protein
VRIEDLIWNETNLDHIAAHHVEQYEVEEVCYGDVYLERRRGKRRYFAFGQTHSGRHLIIFLDHRGSGFFYVVSARDMSKTERRYYRRRRGK